MMTMLGRRNLDSILSGFTKIQKQLEGYTAQVVEDLGVNEIKIAQLEGTRRELREGAEKANKVYANLSKLLGE